MQRLLMKREVTDFTEIENDEISDKPKVDFITYLNYYVEFFQLGWVCKLCSTAFGERNMIRYNHWHMKHNRFENQVFRQPAPWFITTKEITIKRPETKKQRRYWK